MNNVFAARLKKLREKVNLSQGALAQKVGLSRGSISFYENGERTPDIEAMKKFKDFFGVSYDYLMGDSPIENGAVLDELLDVWTPILGLINAFIDESDIAESGMLKGISDTIQAFSFDQPELLDAYTQRALVLTMAVLGQFIRCSLVISGTVKTHRDEDREKTLMSSLSHLTSTLEVDGEISPEERKKSKEILDRTMELLRDGTFFSPRNSALKLFDEIEDILAKYKAEILDIMAKKRETGTPDATDGGF